MFQSQGRFFGGCCSDDVPHLALFLVVSIAGAILWGVLLGEERGTGAYLLVSIAGAILWGVLRRPTTTAPTRLPVSIAGAILWGVLLTRSVIQLIESKGFNRRGDSLGGAANGRFPGPHLAHSFNRRGDSLGGAAGSTPDATAKRVGFNRRGDSLGGAA